MCVGRIARFFPRASAFIRRHTPTSPPATWSSRNQCSPRTDYGGAERAGLSEIVTEGNTDAPADLPGQSHIEHLAPVPNVEMVGSDRNGIQGPSHSDRRKSAKVSFLRMPIRRTTTFTSSSIAATAANRGRQRRLRRLLAAAISRTIVSVNADKSRRSRKAFHYWSGRRLLPELPAPCKHSSISRWQVVSRPRGRRPYRIYGVFLSTGSTMARVRLLRPARAYQDALANTQSGAALPVGQLRARAVAVSRGDLCRLAKVKGGRTVFVRLPTNRGGVLLLRDTSLLGRFIAGVERRGVVRIRAANPRPPAPHNLGRRGNSSRGPRPRNSGHVVRDCRSRTDAISTDFAHYAGSCVWPATGCCCSIARSRRT